MAVGDPTVTQNVYVENIPNLQEVHINNSSDFLDVFTQGIAGFYKHYVVTTADQSFQVFQSFSYGEMTIALLLTVFIVLYGLKWVWEVLR
jgi:hypothetical protein